MSLQDITITASINSIATQSYGQRTYIASTEEQSFPIETITGSQAGSFPNFVPGTDYTVDLIVNVTQSWSGSNTTPLGIVPYLHNTMEEFIDGEFSGSNYIVSNGNLNDADCEQFLTVNTTPTSYSVFPYSVYRDNGIVQGTSQFGVFINDLTAPPDGGILLFKEDDDFSDVPPTVKYVRITYLKISRFDKEGNDNTLSLQELTNIRWNDIGGVGLIDLKVLNISEYPTYYLYAVSSKIWVNPLYIPGDDNTLNYSLSASFIGPSASAGLQYLDNWTVHNVSGGTFDTFYYTFNNPSPNINIKYTASITAYNGNTSPVTFNFGFWGNTYAGTEISYTPIAQTQSVVLNFGDTKIFILSGSTNSSFIGNPSVQYHLETSNLNLPISLSNTFWIVSHSVAPQLSTSSAVLEPYLLSNFVNSDCDVLMNNYSENDISTFYQEVLYDNGGTIPSNLQQIINGTAQFAEVNDYLYNASANRLPRYEGVRTTSPGFNLPSQNGLSNEELADIPFSSNLTIDNGTPNVENTTTYFGYFTSLKSNNPIFKGTTSPILKYLIREDGEVFNPASDEASYYNIIDSFPRGTKAYTNLLYNTTTIFSSTQSVLLSGESYSPILYTISASIGDNAYFTNVIDFGNIQGTSNGSGSYDFKGQSNYGFLNPGLKQNIWYNGGLSANILYDTSSGYYTGGTPGLLSYPSFKFNGTPQNFVEIECTGRFYAVNNSRQYITSAYRFELWLLRGGTTSSLGFLDTATSYSSINQDAGFITTFFPLPNDQIYATFENKGGFKIEFQYVPQLIITTKNLNIPSISADFWTTGSNFDTVLTSSISLGAVIKGNYKQSDIPSSGFDPIELPCQPKIGDEIRFEYDESLSYRIIDVLPSSSGTNPITYLYLDKTIPPGGFDINHFTIRRKVKDYITGITLDSNLISQIDEGFLLPEYPSTDLKNNLSKIINDLSQKNVI